jgi:multidrug efflux system outer membrane protein
VATAVLAVLLAGCTLAPEYRRPTAPIAAQWPASPAEKASSDGRAATDLSWQELFADAKLRQILQLALDNNRDLRVAVLNIEKARAQYRAGIAVIQWCGRRKSCL